MENFRKMRGIQLFRKFVDEISSEQFQFIYSLKQKEFEQRMHKIFRIEMPLAENTGTTLKTLICWNEQRCRNYKLM